jgi:UDP-N-acetylmuramate dehydrogenase
MALPSCEREAEAVVAAAAEFGVRPFFMGNGTNLLAPDGAMRRFVVKISDRMGAVARENETTLSAGSGVPLSRLAQYAAGHALSGLEFAQGIRARWAARSP